MSIRIMSLVWENSPQGGEKLLVLLALADSSDDDGCCRIELKDIAEKARISEGDLKGILKELLSMGFMTMEKEQGVYRIMCEEEEYVY